MDFWGKTDKLAVVHITETGHVLGAATRLGGGEESPTVVEVAGDAMAVDARDDTVVPPRWRTRITRDLLGTSLVDFNEQALRTPYAFVLAEKSLSLPGPTVVSAGLIVITSKQYLRLQLSSNVSEAPHVLLRADGPRTIEVVLRPDPPSSPTNVFNLQLADPLNVGELFDLVVAVAGHALYFKKQVVVA